MAVAVSVVVPVYNTSRYLNQCVDSLIRQSLRDVEFIFVDDGSTDQSVNILEQYQKKDSRIKILKQKNQYAGVARNHGMEIATGKYIIFLDSDDYFEPDMLRDSFRCAEKNHAQIVMFGHRAFHDTLHTVRYQSLLWRYQLPTGVFAGEDFGENLFCWSGPAPWNKFFLREFIEAHQLRFQAVKKCNDAFFVFMALALAERIVFINKTYVNYRYGNADSLQGARNVNRESYIDLAVSLKKGMSDAGVYHGNIRKAEIKYAQELVNYSIQTPYTKEALEAVYFYTKDHLIPDIFESRSDFEENCTVKNIYESSGFDDFLCRQLEYEKNDKARNYVPVSSLNVRVGKRLLAVPMAILRFLKG